MTRGELLARREFIGSSDVSIILGLNKYQNIVDLWLEKTGQVEPDVSSSLPAELGNALEPGLCELYSKQNGVGVVRGVIMTHTEHRFLKAQLDGFVLSEPSEHLEIKTAGLLNPNYNYDDWGEPGTDRVPFAYLVQAQFALMCSGLSRVNLYALLGNNRLNHYIIDRNEKLHDLILERCLAFWDCVKNNIRPSEEVPHVETMARRYREPEKIEVLDEKHVIEWQSLKDQEALIKAAVDAKKAEILDAMQDAEVGATPIGSFYYMANVKGVRSFKLRGANNDL